MVQVPRTCLYVLIVIDYVTTVLKKLNYITYDMIRQVTPVMRFRDHIGPSSDTFTVVPGSIRYINYMYIYIYGEIKYTWFRNLGNT